MKHLELVNLWNNAHTAWADDEALPPELEAWRDSYSGTGKNAVDALALPEPWVGDLDSNPTAVTLSLHPGSTDKRFHHRDGAWPNTIADHHDGSYAAWAATGPYSRDVWESSHGVHSSQANRTRFLSAWTGTDLSPSQVVDVSVYPWHVGDWASASYRPDRATIDEFVFEPIASAGASWAFGFGKDWWELIERLDLPILDRLGDGGRPYLTQVDHRRWLVAEGPDGLRIAVMRMDSGPIPPKSEEVDDLRRVLENGPAGDDVERNTPIALESDLSARLREMDMSYVNIVRVTQAIDDVDLAFDAWQTDEDDAIALVHRDEVVVTVHPEFADFLTEAPSGTSPSPGTDGARRLPLPVTTTTRVRNTRKENKEPKPLGMCPECFNVLNPDGSCPMECGT